MNLPRPDIVPVDPARNVAEKYPPSRPGAQHQPPQVSMDGSQFVQWLSIQAGNMAGDLQQNVRALMVRASSPMPVSDGRDEVSSLRQQLRHPQQVHKELQTMLRNQALAIETFQSKWQMAGQEAHAFIARTRAQSEDFARAELTAVQRFEDSLQRQCDGQLRSHVHALQDECREHVGQEEDKMRRELQHALTQESSVCHDQLQQTLRHHVCQEEYADAAAHQEMEQLRQLISQQAEAMKRFESQSQQHVTQQHDEWTHKQLAQFQKFDGVIRDKDEVIQSLRQELANNKEQHPQEVDQALQDAERRAQQTTPVFAGTSTQPYATPMEKTTLTAVAGLRDDVTIASLQDACLKLVVLARARARELQVDQQVERAQQPLSAKTAAIPTTKPKPKSAPAPANQCVAYFSNQMDARMETIASMLTRALMVSAWDVVQSLTSRLVPVLGDNSLLDQTAWSLPQRRLMPNPRAEPLTTKDLTKDPRREKKSKGKSKGKGSQTKPTAKSGDVDFDDNAQADQDDQEEAQARDEPQEDDPEAFVFAAATSSSESDIESDGMLDWSASECKDYKVGIATVACAASDSIKTHKDTWEWRGPCCLVRAHRQLRRCLFTPTGKEDIWQGLTVHPQWITHVKLQDRSFLSPVIEHVKSVEYLKPRKVSYPWTGGTHFRVTPAACGNSVFQKPPEFWFQSVLWTQWLFDTKKKKSTSD